MVCGACGKSDSRVQCPTRVTEQTGCVLPTLLVNRAYVDTEEKHSSHVSSTKTTYAGGSNPLMGVDARTLENTVGSSVEMLSADAVKQPSSENQQTTQEITATSGKMMDSEVTVVELDPAENEHRDITSKACACCCSTVKEVAPQPTVWAPMTALAACGGALVGGTVGGLCAAKLVAEKPTHDTYNVNVLNVDATEEIVVNSLDVVDSDVAVVELDPAEIETRDTSTKTCACCCKTSACCCSTVQKIEPKPTAWAPMTALAACVGALVGGTVGGLCVAKHAAGKPSHDTYNVNVANFEATEDIVSNSLNVVDSDVSVVKINPARM